MSDVEEELVFDTIIDAPVEKIWRALTIPEYRDRWLDKPAHVSLTLEAVEANSLLTYRWEERNEESLVTIELVANENGTTGFRLTHAPVIVPAAANSNDTLALAA